MRFDWYQATVGISVSAVHAGLKSLPGVSVVRPGKGAGHGYSEGYDAFDSDERLIARAMWGEYQKPNICGSGEHAPLVSSWLRSEHPDHSVSRLDVAHDEDHEGLFDKWLPLVRSCAVQGRVKSGRMVQPDDINAGRTYYAGAPQSAAMVRLYEKGLQLRGRGLDVSPNIARLELQLRPQKTAKKAAAKLTPFQCWSVAKWTRLVLKACVGKRAEDVDLPSIKSDLDTAFDHLMSQYGGTMMRYGAREARVKHGIVAGHVDPADAIQFVLERMKVKLECDWLPPDFGGSMCPDSVVEDAEERYLKRKQLWDPEGISEV
ncbi:replication initiation factor domain-containing protein [Acetobacter pomorum]|uniref:Replication Protein n=3 Tax=Acetobacter pomorum TaxID=65959 RepID=F1YWH3_9PROT|nr:replication initiation factor domain-containing protein [Acetobacter pomorum]EGE46863.1 Replication Protein [Acetobacter pomorum DM001]KAA8421814.1 replication initiation factor domain-containing protein [Acetobacter pomorum]KAA8435254.1 replication initiation factor domain-containing protein [Acetobacter pomorum]KGB23107.1 hypothetical protein ApDm4_2187 [Acetobacter pomorum]